MSAPRRILIVAGGTGGHIFPALAVAEHLRRAHVTPAWLGSEQGLEGRIVPKHDIALHRIAIRGVRGKGVLRWLAAPWTVAHATLQAIRAILRLDPGVVLGMGGFVAGPGGLAAWLCRRPLVIHEQNARPGLTNRLLRHLATRVLSAYPGTFAPGPRVQVTGNPVRTEIASVLPPAHRPVDTTALRVLILGGSQGARALNRIVPAGLAALAGAGVALKIRHQSGERDLAGTQDAYRSRGLDARVEAFIDDMAAAYAEADLVICRAGALTVAELSAVGVASILVPFPFAVDDHQTANARYLADHGAAVLVPEPELTPARIAGLVRGLVDDRAGLVRMACNARACAFPHATETVAGACLELLNATA